MYVFSTKGERNVCEASYKQSCDLFGMSPVSRTRENNNFVLWTHGAIPPVNVRLDCPFTNVGVMLLNCVE